MAFQTLAAALKQYFDLTKQNPDEIYIWIDIFCINQHTQPEEGSRNTLMSPASLDALARVLQRSPRVLLVMDQNGECFSRTWVLWELWQVWGYGAGIRLEDDVVHILAMYGLKDLRFCSILRQASSAQKQQQQSQSREGTNSLSSKGSSNQIVVLPVSWSWDDPRDAFAAMDLDRSRTGISAAEASRLQDAGGTGAPPYQMASDAGPRTAAGPLLQRNSTVPRGSRGGGQGTGDKDVLLRSLMPRTSVQRRKQSSPDPASDPSSLDIVQQIKVMCEHVIQTLSNMPTFIH